MEIQVTLPTVVTADDYHEFFHLGAKFSELLGRTVSCKEIGFDYETQRYVGVVYPGLREPKRFIKSERKKLAVKAEEFDV
jgi:hypothetical protein